MIMTTPMIMNARIPTVRLPPVLVRTASALKNTPEPMTVPTTRAMATGKVYRFSIVISFLTFLNRGQFVILLTIHMCEYTMTFGRLQALFSREREKFTE